MLVAVSRRTDDLDAPDSRRQADEKELPAGGRPLAAVQAATEGARDDLHPEGGVARELIVEPQAATGGVDEARVHDGVECATGVRLHDEHEVPELWRGTRRGESSVLARISKWQGVHFKKGHSQCDVRS